MFDFKKLDVFFAEDSLKKKGRENDRNIVRRTRAVRLVKLLLPAVAAALAGLLIVLPGLQDRGGDLQLNIAKPKDGERRRKNLLRRSPSVYLEWEKKNAAWGRLTRRTWRSPCTYFRPRPPATCRR